MIKDAINASVKNAQSGRHRCVCDCRFDLSVIWLTGMVVLTPLALVWVFGGIGIQRRRVWSAYGITLFNAGQLIVLLIVLLQSKNAAADLQKYFVSAVFAVGLIGLYSKAGRALAEEGSTRGSPVPWIVVTTLTIAPFIFFQFFSIPTGSMEDTILAGDKIVVQRFPLGKLQRGELVVFSYPPDRRQSFVKRICGMPGDRIRISQKVLYVNDAVWPEAYAVHKTKYVDAYRDNFPSEPSAQICPGALKMLRENVANGELVVPPGEYFVLGDNRDFSLDSRYWGFVEASDIFGKPVLIYDSQSQAIGSRSGNHLGSWKTVRWQRLFQRL